MFLFSSFAQFFSDSSKSISGKIAPAQLPEPASEHRVAQTGSEVVRDVSKEIGTGAKRAGSSTALLIEETLSGKKPMSANSAAALDLLVEGVGGVLAVTSALWYGAGSVLRATGESAVAKVEENYGPEAGSNGRLGLEVATNCVIACDELTSLPAKFVEGAVNK